MGSKVQIADLRAHQKSAGKVDGVDGADEGWERLGGALQHGVIDRDGLEGVELFPNHRPPLAHGLITQTVS